MAKETVDYWWFRRFLIQSFFVTSCDLAIVEWHKIDPAQRFKDSKELNILVFEWLYLNHFCATWACVEPGGVSFEGFYIPFAEIEVPIIVGVGVGSYENWVGYELECLVRNYTRPTIAVFLNCLESGEWSLSQHGCHCLYNTIQYNTIPKTHNPQTQIETHSHRETETHTHPPI